MTYLIVATGYSQKPVGESSYNSSSTISSVLNCLKCFAAKAGVYLPARLTREMSVSSMFRPSEGISSLLSATLSFWETQESGKWKQGGWWKVFVEEKMGKKKKKTQEEKKNNWFKWEGVHLQEHLNIDVFFERVTLDLTDIPFLQKQRAVSFYL